MTNDQGQADAGEPGIGGFCPRSIGSAEWFFDNQNKPKVPSLKSGHRMFPTVPGFTPSSRLPASLGSHGGTTLLPEAGELRTYAGRAGSPLPVGGTHGVTVLRSEATARPARPAEIGSKPPL